MIAQQELEVPFLWSTIPFSLVNGYRIASKYSLTGEIFYGHKIDEIIKVIKAKLMNENAPFKLAPSWELFSGKVVEKQKDVYVVFGQFQIKGDIVIVKEILPWMSTKKYVEYLKQFTCNFNPIIRQLKYCHVCSAKQLKWS